MKHSVLINLGEFNFGEYHTLDWITFFCAASTNLILMLNMLIAIMGETFTKVRENSEIADYIEIAGMILEVETSFNARRGSEQKSYFQMCEAESILSKKDDILAQDIKVMKKAIFTIRDNLKPQS